MTDYRHIEKREYLQDSQRREGQITVTQRRDDRLQTHREERTDHRQTEMKGQITDTQRRKDRLVTHRQRRE